MVATPSGTLPATLGEAIVDWTTISLARRPGRQDQAWLRVAALTTVAVSAMPLNSASELPVGVLITASVIVVAANMLVSRMAASGDGKG